MDQLIIEIGEKVSFNQKEAVIIRIVNLKQVMIEELRTNLIHTVNISEIEPYSQDDDKTIIPNNKVHSLNDKEWNKAQYRLGIIKPILNDRRNFDLIKEISSKNNVHYTTIYRWLTLYDKTKQVSALAGFKRTGGKGKSRLNPLVNQIIRDAISGIYLKERKSIRKTIREIAKKCKENNLPVPHENTVRNRIGHVREEDYLKSRYGKSAARDKFEPHKGSFPGADFPLSVVQIDHTKLDIILVDEHYREPFLRPWLTLAMDVYSRMVVGFFLSFDPPGEMGTGLCISNAILPKENWLATYDIKEEWLCWGMMKTIHVDNAKEFRGTMLKKACINYGINLEFRPVATPHWGGHVERLLGTFSKEIHDLPGTTFSNISERANYESEKHAALTIRDLEKWLLTYITKIYHKRTHASIYTSPEQKFKEGIFGTANSKGVGIFPRIFDERRLRLDFMPYVERTVQEYGVIIDHITYYHDVMRKYIHARDNLSSNSKKAKFIFRRDPRDISLVYFLDPELNEYFEIPYRDTSKPPMSIWEYKEVLRRLKDRDIPVDETSIFNAYDEMDTIQTNAIQQTKKLKRTSRYADKREKQKPAALPEIQTKPVINNIEPFDDIDDEAFT